jgi:hypothetical protein
MNEEPLMPRKLHLAVAVYGVGGPGPAVSTLTRSSLCSGKKMPALNKAALLSCHGVLESVAQDIEIAFERVVAERLGVGQQYLDRQQPRAGCVVHHYLVSLDYLA